MSSAANPARRAAFETVRRTFEHDAWTDRAFPAAARRHQLEGRDRALAQRLAYGAVQRRGTSDHLIRELSGRDSDTLDGPVATALWLGLFELLYSGAEGEAPVGAHAIVDGWVELAKQGMLKGRRDGARARGAAGLVNAVLRRAAAQSQELLAGLGDDTPERAAVAHSLPAWLAEMWWRELGAGAARRLMAAMNVPLPTALRALDDEGARAIAAGLPGVVAGSRLGELTLPEALVVDGALDQRLLAGIESGELIAQSIAAQAVVAIVGTQPGERVLDMCAGPGIKTRGIALAAGPSGSVVAVERDPDRAAQVEEICARVPVGGAQVEVRTGDATEADLGDGYDRVLVDPPCSDLGTLASRPDARWRKEAETIARLAPIQSRLLERACEAMRPGGAVVYSTCTISRSENQDLVAAVLEREAAIDIDADDLSRLCPDQALAADPRFVQTSPDRDRTDGFFIARLHRRPA